MFLIIRMMSLQSALLIGLFSNLQFLMQTSKDSPGSCIRLILCKKLSQAVQMRVDWRGVNCRICIANIALDAIIGGNRLTGILISIIHHRLRSEARCHGNYF